MSGGEKPNVEPKEFLDIHGKYEHSYSLDELKSEPVVADIVESVKATDSTPSSSSNPFVNSEFYQMDEATTKGLIAECKKHNVTIQSLLSTAEMLSHLNNKNVTSDEATFYNSCPCCMRPYVAPLKHDDIVCGSAALIWPYRVDLAESFWAVTQQTKESIRECLEGKYGFKWWIKLANSIATQPYSIMSSSMGVVSLNESSFRALKINDMRFLGSAYTLNSAMCGIMTHVFTFKNRFTMNFSYTYPVLSDTWAQTFAGNIWRLLNMVAQGKLDDNVNLKSIIDQMVKHTKQ